MSRKNIQKNSQFFDADNISQNSSSKKTKRRFTNTNNTTYIENQSNDVILPYRYATEIFIDDKLC